MRIMLGAVLLAAGAASTGWAQQYPTIIIAGRLQTQGYLFNDENPGAPSNFFIRRARIQANVQVTDRIGLVIQPSFEGGRATGVRLRDAYFDVRLTPNGSRTELTLRTGAEKVPFGRYELLSSNNLPTIDRSAGRGLQPTASNNLFEAGGFIQTDLGASLTLSQRIGTRTLVLKTGIYNGQGESLHDVNGAKSLGLRASFDVTSKLGIGATVYSHDGIVALSPTESDSSFRNQAVGLEAQWGKPGDRGLFAVVDYMTGESFTAERRPMRGVSVVTAYHVRTGAPGGTVYAIEPVLRFDWADPDADTRRNGSTLLTAGLNLYLTPRAQLRLMFESQNPDAPGAPTLSGIRGAMTINFESRPLSP